MKKSLLTITASACLIATQAINADEKPGAAEKPTQHLKLPDITTEKQATVVMKATTGKLKAKKKLDAGEMHEIHIITYSLEKAVAYFVENTKGDQQAISKKMAVVVEEVHLNSENNRKEETRKALDHYFKLAKSFTEGMAKAK